MLMNYHDLKFITQKSLSESIHFSPLIHIIDAVGDNKQQTEKLNEVMCHKNGRLMWGPRKLL